MIKSLDHANMFVHKYKYVIYHRARETIMYIPHTLWFIYGICVVHVGEMLGNNRENQGQSKKYLIKFQEIVKKNRTFLEQY